MSLPEHHAEDASGDSAGPGVVPAASVQAAGPAGATGWRVRMVDRDDPVADLLIAELGADLAHRYGDEDRDPDAPPLPQYQEADIVCAAVVETSSGEPAGCGLLIMPSGVPEKSTTGELKHIYVRPEFRGRRLAELILNTFIDHARRLGLSRLILITGTPQPEALALYRRTGWRLIPAYGGWQPFSGAFGFEYPLWDQRPPATAARLVRERSTSRALIIDEQQRVLLTHNLMPGHDHWALPGGGLREGESHSAAARRELLEETGIRVDDLAGPVIMHDYWVLFTDSPLHQTEEIFWGRTTQHDLTREGLGADEDYLVDVAWWPLEALTRTTARIYPRLLSDLAATLIQHGTPSEPYRITPAPPSAPA